MAMKLFNENRDSRVMVFIDYRNLLQAFEFDQEVGRIDLYRLTKILVGDRELIGAYIFDGMSSMFNEGNRLNKLHNQFRELGFRVMARESIVKQINGEYVQKEVDVALACEVLEHAMRDHYDIAIIISGDRDFVPAIQKVQSAGKRVEVAAFSGSLSEESKRNCDAYHILDMLPVMEMVALREES